MIFLIDDNQNNQRLINYNIQYLDEGLFDGYLHSIDKLEFKKDFSDVSHLDFLKEADCILLHSSTEDFDENRGFISGSKTNVIKIKEIISQEGEIVPLVLFSNSMGEAEFDFQKNPNYLSSIKKNTLYERLNDFLEHYKSKGEVELRILAWGRNFLSKEVSKLANKIIDSLETKQNIDVLKLNDLSHEIRVFQTFINLTLPNYDINEIMNQIEDNPVTVQDFKRKINLINESYAKYGKNIYSWE